MPLQQVQGAGTTMSLLLEITSSDFPNHDRNHNTGRNDLADTELVPAEQKLYHTNQYPSRLIVNSPGVEGSEAIGPVAVTHTTVSSSSSVAAPATIVPNE